MLYRALAAAVFTSLTLTSAVQAQQAAQSPGPLFAVTQNGGWIHALSDLPVSAPNAPVDYWELYFLAEPQISGGERFDVLAVRLRLDCSAKTVRTLSQEAYLNDTFVAGSATGPEEPSRQIGALSLADTIMKVVCDPQQRAFYYQYPNWTAARRSFDEANIE